MDGSMKHLRVRFSGLEQQDQSGSRKTSVSSRRGQMSSGEEFDAAYAASVAAAAYAIAAREEEKLARTRKASPVEATAPAPPSPPPPQPVKFPSKISRWFSGKESPEDEDAPGANVSVRRPLRPAQAKPEDTATDQKVAAASIKRAPSFSSQPADTKGSRRYEPQQEGPKAPPPVRLADPGPAKRTSEAEARAYAWEQAKLAKIREEYEKMMGTIAEWETEKKVKAKRQKDQKEIELDRKRAKVLEEYKEEMSRINKIVGGARSTAEERRRNEENKIRLKAEKIRSTGKLPRSCICF